MLNTVLAWTAAAVWSAAYGIFFARDLRRWWRNRGQRREQNAAERARAIAAYAAWARNIPPPPSRQPIMPPPPRRPAPIPQSRYGGNVVPFPRRAARRG
jgi:hypothetical protein